MVKIISVKEAARLYRKSEASIRELCASNDLDAEKIGRDWRIKVGDDMQIPENTIDTDIPEELKEIKYRLEKKQLLLEEQAFDVGMTVEQFIEARDNMQLVVDKCVVEEKQRYGRLNEELTLKLKDVEEKENRADTIIKSELAIKRQADEYATRRKNEVNKAVEDATATLKKCEAQIQERRDIVKKYNDILKQRLPELKKTINTLEQETVDKRDYHYNMAMSTNWAVLVAICNEINGWLSKVYNILMGYGL